MNISEIEVGKFYLIKVPIEHPWINNFDPHLYQNTILECVGAGKFRTQFKLHPNDTNEESYWNFNKNYVIKEVAAPLSGINCICKQPWYFGHVNTCTWAIAKSSKI